MNVQCVCFILTDYPCVLYVSISFSSQYMDTTFCFSKVSPVLPVMVGRVFVYFIRLPYLCGYCKVIRLETAWRILLSVKIASILGLGCLSHSTKNKSLPENMNTIDKRCNHSHYTPLSGRLGWIAQKPCGECSEKFSIADINPHLTYHSMNQTCLFCML